MSRFSAATLDLSRFPPPLALRGYDFETIRLAGLSRLGELLTAVGIPWEVASLEANPAAMINRAFSYREFLVYLAVNDAVRAVMVAFATGPDLAHLGASFGVQRRVIVAATVNTQAVMETDDELRRRILLAPEAFAAAGPVGAYVFHALTADPRVLNVDVWSPQAGSVAVAVQSRDGDGTASEDLVRAVRAHLYRDDIKPLTDVVEVRSVVNIPYAIDVEAFVLPGPDTAMVRSTIVDSLSAMAASRRTPSRDVPLSAIASAASIPAVDRVDIRAPLQHVAAGRGEAATCTAVNVVVTTYDG